MERMNNRKIKVAILGVAVTGIGQYGCTVEGLNAGFKGAGVAGAYRVDLDRHEDERGSFARTFCQHEFAELGLDTARIVFERNSRNTYENARYTRELLAAHGLRRVLLVTSAAHMRFRP